MTGDFEQERNAKRMSVKYELLKAVFRIVPFQKIMAKPYDQLMKIFKTADANPSIPALSDPELTFETITVDRSPVLMIRHKKPAEHLCVYFVGGGMLKYPKPFQAKSLVGMAKETGRDFALPYFPLCPQNNLFDALDMLYDMYGILLKAYRPENIAFLGGSSGAFMALCLVSYINRDKEKLPIPGKLCLCSPGSALEAEERKAAERLNRTDLIMSMAALDNIFAGMAGGKALPEYLRYMQRGIYTGVKDVYLTYGGDEVFSAAAESTAARLRSYGAAVELEIGRGLYHAYAALPLVPEAKPAYQRVIQYLKV